MDTPRADFRMSKRLRSGSSSSLSSLTSLSSLGSVDAGFPSTLADGPKAFTSHPNFDLDQLLLQTTHEQETLSGKADIEAFDDAVVQLPGRPIQEGPTQQLALFTSPPMHMQESSSRSLSAHLTSVPDLFRAAVPAMFNPTDTEAAATNALPATANASEPAAPDICEPAATNASKPPAINTSVQPPPEKRSTRRNRTRAPRRREKKREFRLKQVQANLLRKIKVIEGHFDATNLPKAASGYIGKACKKNETPDEPHSGPIQDEMLSDAHPYLHELGRRDYRLVKADDSVDLFMDNAERIFGWNARTFGSSSHWRSTYAGVERAFAELVQVVRKDKAVGRGSSGGVPRGNHTWSSYGFSCGGGEKHPTSSLLSQKDHKAWQTFLQNPHVKKTLDALMASFQMWAPDVYKTYCNTHKAIVAQNALLDFIRSDDPSKVPFSSITANLGPQTVCFRHRDMKNKSNGMCIIYVLGNFDYRRGGHIILHEPKLVVEMRPGDALFLPSAVISHETVPIAQDEERYSLVLYSAGGLFRWVDSGSRLKADWKLADKPGHDEHFSSVNAELRWKEGWTEYETLNSLCERQSRLEQEIYEEQERRKTKSRGHDAEGEHKRRKPEIRVEIDS